MIATVSDLQHKLTRTLLIARLKKAEASNKIQKLRFLSKFTMHWTPCHMWHAVPK